MLVISACEVEEVLSYLLSVFFSQMCRNENRNWKISYISIFLCVFILVGNDGVLSV